MPTNRSRLVMLLLVGLGVVLTLFVYVRLLERARDLLPTGGPPASDVARIPTEPAPTEPASAQTATRAATRTPRPTAASTALPSPTATLSKTGEISASLPITLSEALAAGVETSEALGRVNVDAVNLRGGPGTVYARLGQVRRGASFEIMGRSKDGAWWQICCPVGNDEPSWISAQFVDAALPDGTTAQDVAIVDPPAAPQAAAAAPAPAPVNAAPGVPNVAQTQSTATTSIANAPAPGLPGPGSFSPPSGMNPLTGLPLAGGRAGQRPIVVAINNDPAARPQLGTSQADVMYEYLMEGLGITRFSGVFYGDEAAQIGPVRSARLINYYLGALYNAGVVASGASNGVRFTMKHESPSPYLDIDLDDPSQTRYSVSVGGDYRTRVRTSTAGARRWLAEWGVEGATSVRGFTFGDAPAGSTATSIAIPYPGGSGVSYTYSDGRYLRFMGGYAHVDGNTRGQLALDNVVVQYVPHEVTNIVEDSLGSLSIRLNLFGSGRAIVFRDGIAVAGTWQSNSRGDTPRFFDGAGAEVALKPGRTWISVVPLSYSVQY